MNAPKLQVVFIEVHPKNQSLVNLDWSWKNVELVRRGQSIKIIFQAKINTKVNTRKHICNKNNNLKLTNCYDNFYMTKLNCSFPWQKNIETGFLQKCGSNDSIYDFLELINHRQEHNISKEIADFGCKIPNCKNINWRIIKTDIRDAAKKNRLEIYAIFSSSSKVYITFNLTSISK